MITQSELKRILNYNSETGIFIWNVKVGSWGMPAGSVAGVPMRGYISISIRGKKYYAHRLAWLYMEGYCPENQIDHINRIKNDNKWCNLRHVSHQCNMRNKTMQKNNISGVTGVYWKKIQKKWLARIRANNKDVYIGYYDDFKAAVLARWEAEKKYDYPSCNTTSTAYNYLLRNGIIK